jgi:transposase
MGLLSDAADGRFAPVTREGAVTLTPAQLSMLCEGIDWRSPLRTKVPLRAG